ncbi:MAG: PHP domain-containing protein [Bacteroidetes bacterium]|nr:PHP domain-containing protein [Bacteroidota bacterium]
MEIINPGTEDYHIHSLNFSDGLNTIDEIVKYAGEIGLTKIAITDHCQAYLDKRDFHRKTYYNIINRWENIHNEVEVVFGIEADVLNAKGDVSMDIQGKSSEFILLSSHPSPPYEEDPKSITEGYLNAIERYRDRITFLAHPCSVYYQDYIDIKPIIELCNKYDIPMEFNCVNLINNKTNMKNLELVLSECHYIYVNSDAHTLNELKNARNIGMTFLKEHGYLK